MYAFFRVIDASAVKFLNASLVAEHLEYYPKFFENFILEAPDHQTETAKRSITDQKKFPVDLDQIFKAV